jgi:hypothetical protein
MATGTFASGAATRARVGCRTSGRGQRGRGSSSTSSTGCRHRSSRPRRAWNCKAGKCGSCSAEINGRPRLLCMTRMSTFAQTRRHRDAAARLPVIRDLSPTCRSTTKGRECRVRSPAARRRGYTDAAGRRRAIAGVPQVHRVLPVPGHLHVIRDHEENKASFAGPAS